MQKARRRGIIYNIFDKWPGRKRFGPYRFIPIFFVLGAALEFSMIKWTVGETNFYRVYKRNQVEREAISIIEREKLNKGWMDGHMSGCDTVHVRMPYRVSWGYFIRYTVVAMLAMFTGAQAVHHYYKPLQDYDVLVQKKVAEIKEQEMRNNR